MLQLASSHIPHELRPSILLFKTTYNINDDIVKSISQIYNVPSSSCEFELAYDGLLATLLCFSPSIWGLIFPLNNIFISYKIKEKGICFVYLKNIIDGRLLTGILMKA
jgi:hypothetical protein